MGKRETYTGERRVAIGEKLKEVGGARGLVGVAALGRSTVATSKVRSRWSFRRGSGVAERDLENATPPRAEAEPKLAAIVVDNVRVDCDGKTMLDAETHRGIMEQR